MKSNQLICSPKRKKPRNKPVREVDHFDQVAIRNAVYEMYRESTYIFSELTHNFYRYLLVNVLLSEQHITRKSLLMLLKERDIFNGSVATLGKILKDIGFRWKKNDPRRGLMELEHIALRRIEFLQKYVKNVRSANPTQVVYLDETWIFENGSGGRSWQDDNRKSVKRTKSEGKR